MSVWLGCLFPLAGRVRVVWTNTLAAYPPRLGECAHFHRQGRFEIRLRPGMSAEVALTTLAHEWAHALTMPGMMVGEDYHSERFYSVYGQIERAWEAGGRVAAARLCM